MNITSIEILPLHGQDDVPLECRFTLRATDHDGGDLISLAAAVRLRNANWSLLEIEEFVLRECGRQLALLAEGSKEKREAIAARAAKAAAGAAPQ